MKLNEMSSSRLACRSKNAFCYICGESTIVPNRNPVTKFIKRAYHTYFGMKVGDQDKAWVPHMVCKKCTEYLHHWTNDKKNCLKFRIPIVWREPANHGTDCYFCVINVTGINRKSRSSLKYPDLQSARVLQLIMMKSQYLYLENFLTLVAKIPQVLKRMKRKRFLTMMLHTLFHKWS